jgi:hypothetical protein
LSASVAGQAEVEVTIVSTSKRWTRLDVELWQYNDPTTTTRRDYTDRQTVRTLRIRAHYLFTQLENVYDLPTSPPVSKEEPTKQAVPTYLARPCPILRHPAELKEVEYSEVPAKFGFKEGMRWKEVECVDDGEGELRWACWFELTQGEDLTKLAGEHKTSFPFSLAPFANGRRFGRGRLGTVLCGLFKEWTGSSRSETRSNETCPFVGFSHAFSLFFALPKSLDLNSSLIFVF